MSLLSRIRLFHLLVLLPAALLGGCESVTYLAQAIHGQSKLLLDGKPILSLIQTPKTPSSLHRQLTTVQSILDFAEQELALPSGDSYRNYVALDRKAVVYNVFATPALSLQPRQWCFPIVGCVLYRGYFSIVDARRFAKVLRERGNDVYVGGAAAYSTLGWLADPLLSTMLGGSQADLAALLFHELTHRRLFVKGQTRFNESLATLVEQEGLRRWLLAHNQAAVLAQYQTLWQNKAAVLQLIAKYRDKLASLYASKESINRKKVEKKHLFAMLKTTYQNGFGDQTTGLRWWFKGTLNNAALLPVSTYNDLLPAFTRLLANQKGNFRAFFRILEKIAATADPVTALRQQTVYTNTLSTSAHQR